MAEVVSPLEPLASLSPVLLLLLLLAGPSDDEPVMLVPLSSASPCVPAALVEPVEAGAVPAEELGLEVRVSMPPELSLPL